MTEKEREAIGIHESSNEESQEFLTAIKEFAAELGLRHPEIIWMVSVPCADGVERLPFDDAVTKDDIIMEIGRIAVNVMDAGEREDAQDGYIESLNERMETLYDCLRHK